MKQMMMRAALAGAMSITLAGCGSGGDEGNPAPAKAIAGLYTGTLDYSFPPASEEPAGPAIAKDVSTSSTFQGNALALVLDSGEFFVVSDLFGPWGTALHGNLAPRPGETLHSTNMKLFAEGTKAISVTAASYVSQDNVLAALETEDLATLNLALEDFSSDTPTLATLSDIPEWIGGDVRSFSGARPYWPQFTISSTGAMTNLQNYQVEGNGEDIADEDCASSGQITPVKGGYTITVSFGTGCHWSGQTLKGLLVLDPERVSPTLRGVLVNADRSKAEIVQFYDRSRS